MWLIVMVAVELVVFQDVLVDHVLLLRSRWQSWRINLGFIFLLIASGRASRRRIIGMLMRRTGGLLR